MRALPISELHVVSHLRVIRAPLTIPKFRRVPVSQGRKNEPFIRNSSHHVCLDSYRTKQPWGILFTALRSSRASLRHVEWRKNCVQTCDQTVHLPRNHAQLSVDLVIRPNRADSARKAAIAFAPFRLLGIQFRRHTPGSTRSWEQGDEFIGYVTDSTTRISSASRSADTVTSSIGSPWVRGCHQHSDTQSRAKP